MRSPSLVMKLRERSSVRIDVNPLKYLRQLEDRLLLERQSVFP